MSSLYSSDRESMKRATSAFINAWKIPQLTSVRFEGSADLNQTENREILNGAVTLKSTWAQSSVASGSKISFSRTDFCVQENASSKEGQDNDFGYKCISSMMPSPNDPDSFISDYCSKNQLEVLIRKRAKVGNKDETQYILEVWKPNNLLNSINLTELDAHGDVYLDSELGSLSINSQGTKIAYIAEEKRPKSEPFFKGYGASVISSSKGKIIFRKFMTDILSGI